MEQSDIPQTQVFKPEGLSTNLNVQTDVAEVVTKQDVKAVIITEDGHDMPNACKLQLESTLPVDNIKTGIKSNDYVDGSNTDTIAKEIDSDANDYVKHESNKADTEKYIPEKEDVKINEDIKDEFINPNYESQSLSNKEDQSLNMITESNTVEAGGETTDISKSNVIKDANQSDTLHKQCPTLDKSLSEHSGDQIYDAHESVKEPVNEIHDNDSNQNNTIVMDAEPTKLLHGETEVVVVVEETIPVTADASADDVIVTVDKQNAKNNCSQETIATLQEKKPMDPGHEVNEFDNLINYNQESDSTIIEVISTEVVHTPVTEQHEQQDKEDYVENNKCDIESVKITDGKIAINKNINDDDIGAKAVDSEKLISSVSKDNMEDNMEDNSMEDNTTIIIDEKIIITEDADPDPDDPEATDVPQIENAHANITEEAAEHKQYDSSAHETSTEDSSMKKRSVIQDIFDDWGVENVDEDAQSTSKVHDSVEIELKSLLDEAKTDQIITSKSVTHGEKIASTNKECVADGTRNVANIIGKNVTKQLNEQMGNQKKGRIASQDTASLNKNDKDSVSAVGKSSRAFNATPQVTKNRSRHLTSQIASPAEVTEVLKERLREKQKVVVDAPLGPDIFFVKKLTQRLSSKLAGGPVAQNPMPPLVPLPQQSTSPPLTSASAQSTADNCDRKTTTGNTITETSKDGNSDNKELLAILEGDVDPDWSILKPPILTEEDKIPSNVEHSDHSSPPKLDPLVEREMALKQLLELPVTTSKKNPPRKKKTFKPAPNRASKDIGTKSPVTTQGQKKVVSTDSANENAKPHAKHIEIDLSSREQSSSQKVQDVEHISQNTRAEESRSGRKRKLTEKAREHEQNTIKRQKVYKGKVSISKRQTQENNSVSDDSLTTEDAVVIDAPEVNVVNNEKPIAKEVTNKQFEDLEPVLSKSENSALKRPKENVSRKASQPITKRKIVVKKLLRQKMPSNKKSVKLKTKLSSSLKKSSKVVSKSQKRTAESISGDAKPKKKNINEIDRLLQDEGVVNLLYDVEQPDKKRLVPITKSRAKVMDLQKVQRELKIRKKLVRNAVLRLRTPTGAVTKVSPRSKRTAVQPSDVQADRKMGEQIASPKIPNASSPTEFILPAKIRNAADASIIVRRHSSSSFSSASGSPRVSIDAPDKPTETAKLDDGTIHSLRSAKRRHSQDEKVNVKRSKKKTIDKSDTDVITTSATTATTNAASNATTSTTTTTTTIINATVNNAEEKIIPAARPSKKSEIKKIDKTSKQQENIPALENNITSSKVTTRSNGAATGKVTAKSKRAAKSKINVSKGSDVDNVEDSSKEEDELSACLAEAATALSIVGTGSRSGNITTTRKSKGRVNTSIAKMLDLGNTKTETQGQFRNKEINIRRHGNLVQLILTPSSSTRIRNALTLQVMEEFREALSILKRDDKCTVVLLTSTGTSFCEGLELSTLLRTNKEERRSVAQKLAHAVKDFIKSLVTFNKPIVAGVQGVAIGLGVTMLPLFDLVIASDKASFCTPYGKLGQIAEGAAVFTLSHILGSAVTSELLLGGRTLTASEALRAGLVTRVLWPDRFQVELLPSLRAMSDQSSQSMEATKALLRHSLRKKLDAALESETYILIQHWCSAECQIAIKAYIDGKIQ